MSVTTRHAPGTFCWPELATKDQNAAKRFYSDLFGWSSSDSPIGEGESYTIFQKNGKDTAALMQLGAKQAGVPPHWNAYIAVDNVDQSTQKAKQLGGKVQVEPMDVMDHGRMAVIQDPTGAMFCLWQAKNHAGVGVLNETGALCWTELLTPDPAKAKTFYTQLLGWKAEDMPGIAAPYTVFSRSDGTRAGGLMVMPKEAQGPPAWIGYIQVDDARATNDQANRSGAKTLAGPMDIPNVGTFAVIMDPQGAVF